MDDKPHILICGDVGCGKSTLIQKLLAHSGLSVYGFITKRREDGDDGFHPIYIHPAGQPAGQREYERENLIGTCNRKVHNVNLEVFDTLGASYIAGARPDGIIVMDELGFMEARACAFTRAVFDALNGDIPVIAAVKSRKDVPFLDKVREHPRARLFYITKENRDAVLERAIEAWTPGTSL